MKRNKKDLTINNVYDINIVVTTNEDLNADLFIALSNLSGFNVGILPLKLYGQQVK